MIGWRATWRHRDADGQFVVPVDGAIVLHYAHSPSQGMIALLGMPDGTTREEQAKNLVIAPMIASEGSDLATRLDAMALGRSVTAAAEVDLSADRLEVVLLKALRDRLIILGLLTEDSGEGTLHAATRLVSELHDALVQTDARRAELEASVARLTIERDEAAKLAEDLGHELEAARGKKTRAKKPDAG